MAAKSEPSKDPHCPIAKDSRIPADRPRHPWRGRFALRAVQAFLVGVVVSLCVGCRTEVAEGRELVAVRGEPSKGSHCPIAKDSRIPADRPRHPWRGRFALRAVRVFLVWAAASFCVDCRTEVTGWGRRWLSVGCSRKACTARLQRSPASLRIGHAIPGVDALLFGQCGPFLFSQRRRFSML